MGYKLSKKLSDLKKQSQEEKLKKYKLLRVTFLTFICLWLFTSFLTPTSVDPTESWSTTMERTYLERYRWLDNSLLSFSSGKKYKKAADQIIYAFSSPGLDTEDSENWYSPEGLKNFFSKILIGGFLRLSFIVMAFWPLWLIAVMAGYFFSYRYLRPKREKDILGICTPGKTPFYSGIYGPLIPNKSMSGTDYSAPGLACPAQVKKQIALNHKLTSILRSYRAYNETTLSLARIILAYKDYPCFVEDEHRPEDEDRGLDAEIKVSNTSFYSNEAGTIEKSSLSCLPSILAAHQVLVSYYSEQANTGTNPPSFAEFIKIRNELASKLPPFGQVLVRSLTRKRSQAIAKLPASVIATSYLSLEAGKALAYTPVKGGYACNSHYPNLQSRAVLLSLPEFHEEYNGDFRLIMRQAIICARRHRDFGRAFLPVRMPIETRALRDWLEILYVPESRREDQGQFVELDAHLEEIQGIWKTNLSESLRALSSNQHEKLKGLPKLWKGVPYKSVVLMPIKAVIDLALRNVESSRIEHITELMKHAAKFSDIVSVSARLPGFKRQIGTNLTEISQCGEAVQKIAKEKNGKRIIEKWFIVQRMLTRYNWLSTRVGDDAVPNDGLVQVAFNTAEEKKLEVSEFDAAVPIRTRRFRESLSAKWESTFYADAPHPNEIEVFVDANEFYQFTAEQGAGRRPSEQDSGS